MAVLSHDDFMNTVKGLAGDNADDNTLAMIENFTDTFNDLESRWFYPGYSDQYH